MHHIVAMRRVHPLHLRQLLVALLCMTTMVEFAISAARCPLIRPVGLTAIQIDATVVATIAATLGRPLDQLDKTRTLKDLDGTENAILTYSVAALSIGETLGFDAIAIFFDASKAKGGAQPFEALTVSEMQGLSRTAYLMGKDSPPPAATNNDEFALQRISVRPPSPASRWSLLRCTSENIAFQRRGESDDLVATAAASLITLPPYRGTESLLNTVRQISGSIFPPGTTVHSTNVSMAKGTRVPCVNLEVQASSGGAPYQLHARFCYSDKRATLGYAAMFSQTGEVDPRIVASEAQAFILGSSPK